jgi:hypothetical protein
VLVLGNTPRVIAKWDAARDDLPHLIEVFTKSTPSSTEPIASAGAKRDPQHDGRIGCFAVSRNPASDRDRPQQRSCGDAVLGNESAESG